MAKKKADDKPPEKPQDKRLKDLLARIHERVPKMMEADQDNRKQAVSDLEFLHKPGAQWDDKIRRKRGLRPCYEFSSLGTKVNRVINDMRANPAQGKVRPVEEGDKDTAEVIEGIVLNIANNSDFDTVQDTAAQYQVGCGIGAWRIETDYADESFDQDICIKALKNPLNLYPDPGCQDVLKRDANDWALLDRISNVEYDRRWPKAKRNDFEADDFDDSDEWSDENSTRICEYWYKEPVQKTLYQLSDGSTTDTDQDLPEGVEVTRSRSVNGFKLKMCIASGTAILEEGDWVGPDFPFILVYGNYVIVDGKVIWYGMVRNSKDAVRTENATMTAMLENIALAPQAKWWATPKQAEGHTDKWAVAHDENLPFLMANSDPSLPGFPQRMPGADVPAALIQAQAIAAEKLKGTTGIYDASTGNTSNETSGRAITARQKQGEISTYNYRDNMAKGVRRTWEILLRLIPKVITNERAIRILGKDGAEKYIKVNSVKIDPQSLEALPVNDLSRGKYDVTITVGPSYATKREEDLEFWTQYAQTNPNVPLLAGDLVAEMSDSPSARAVAERLKLGLPPVVQQSLSKDGKALPPEAQMALMQAQQQMQQVQELGQVVQEAQANAEKEVAAANKAKADVQVASANLTTQEAQLAQKAAEFKTLVAETQAKFAQESAQASGEDSESKQQAMYQAMSDQIGQALQQIQQEAGALLQHYATQMQSVPGMVMQTMQQEQAAKPARSGRTVQMKRGPKGMTGQVTDTFADGSTQVRNAQIQRGPDGYVGQIDEPGTVQ